MFLELHAHDLFLDLFAVKNTLADQEPQKCIEDQQTIQENSDMNSENSFSSNNS